MYATDDLPNYPDHDFPVPGDHLVPAGYMRLISKSSVPSTMDDCLLEPSQNDHDIEGMDDELECQSSLSMASDNTESNSAGTVHNT